VSVALHPVEGLDVWVTTQGAQAHLLWRDNIVFATLCLCTFGLSTATSGNFEETLVTFKVRTDCFSRAALALLALSLATRFHRGPHKTSTALERVAGCLLIAAFLVRTTGVIATNLTGLRLAKKTSSTFVRRAGCLLVAAVLLRACQSIAAAC